MKKLLLELDSVQVESFATARDAAATLRGTMRAHEDVTTGTLTRDCPTNYCATVPLYCDTVFAPECTGTTCTA
jgi:hypothetical protein